jgi:hypothetical protein
VADYTERKEAMTTILLIVNVASAILLALAFRKIRKCEERIELLIDIQRGCDCGRQDEWDEPDDGEFYEDPYAEINPH